jgi:hypothetical protein
MNEAESWELISRLLLECKGNIELLERRYEEAITGDLSVFYISRIEKDYRDVNILITLLLLGLISVCNILWFYPY